MTWKCFQGHQYCHQWIACVTSNRQSIVTLALGCFVFEILRFFRCERHLKPTPPLFHLEFGNVPPGVERRRLVCSEDPRLFIHVTAFQEFQCMWSGCLNVTDRRTDGRTPYDSITARCTKVHRAVKSHN